MLKCETKLRQTNNLSENSTLTIVQVEIYSNNSRTLTNNVKYAIYDENTTYNGIPFTIIC